MEQIPVKSSNVGYIAYDASNRELHLAFHDRIVDLPWEGCRKYKYFDVDAETFEELKAAESKGSYVYLNIAFEYKYTSYQA